MELCAHHDSLTYCTVTHGTVDRLQQNLGLHFSVLFLLLVPLLWWIIIINNIIIIIIIIIYIIIIALHEWQKIPCNQLLSCNGLANQLLGVQPSSHLSYKAKLKVERYTQTFQPNSSIPAMCIGIIDHYCFIPFSLVSVILTFTKSADWPLTRCVCVFMCALTTD